MRILKVILTIIFTYFIFISCSSSTYEIKECNNEAPGWYVHKPQNTDYIYETGTANSFDMQKSISDAATLARREIAKVIAGMLQDFERAIIGEVKVEPKVISSFTNQSTSIITSVSIAGSQIKEREVCKNKEGYTAFVLIEYPISEAKKIYLDKIKEDQSLSAELQKTQLFMKLNEEVDKYEKWKKEQFSK